MDWTVFWISSAIWVFFSEHFIWLKRFEAMKEVGMPIPASFLGASKGLAMAAMFNQFVFLLVYGFKTSWLWAPLVVFGGYVVALAYVLVTRSLQGMLMHKLGWIGLPALSIYLWFAAFAA